MNTFDNDGHDLDDLTPADFRIRISTRAWEQVAEAADWYAEHVDLDTAVRLEDGFLATVAGLRHFPARYALDGEMDARHVFIPGFPYSVWYETDEDAGLVNVLGIAHGSMSGETVKQRLHP